jgi:hypothetical protein
MISLRDYYKKQVVIPLMIGTSVGSFVAYDIFIANWVSSDLLRIFPYELSALSFILLLMAGVLIFNLDRIIRHKELLFIILFLIGYQTNAIQLFIIDISDITVGIFTLVLFLSALVNKEHRFVRSPINFLNAVFSLCIIFSFIMALNLRTMFILIKSMMLFQVMINFIRKKEFVLVFVKLFIIISSISAVIGIIQQILYLFAGYLFIGVIPPESLELMFEITSMGIFLRVPALMTSYGSLSKMLVINLIMVANLLIYPNTFTKSTKLKLLLCFAFLLMLSALMLTFAKDAILALVIALLISALIRWRSFLIHWLFLYLILFVFCYYSGLLNTFADFISAELTFGEPRIRIALDREGIEGFLDNDIYHMLFGVGIGYGARYTSHHKNWPAHNAFILAADEIGLLGLLAYLALYIIAGLRLISANLMSRDPLDKAITSGLLCGFIAIVIMFQFYAGYIDLIIWFYLGLIESTTLLLIEENKPRP